MSIYGNYHYFTLEVMETARQALHFKEEEVSAKQWELTEWNARQRKNAWMIECEGCQEWFHGNCVGINPDTLGPQVDCYLCEACSAIQWRHHARHWASRQYHAVGRGTVLLKGTPRDVTRERPSFHALPDDVTARIVTSLPPAAACRPLLACRMWASVAQNEPVWRLLCSQRATHKGWVIPTRLRKPYAQLYFQLERRDFANLHQDFDKRLEDMVASLKKKDAPATLAGIIKREPKYDINHRARLEEQNTVLNLAARNGRHGCVKELLQTYGANTEFPDTGGFTPLINASWRGDLPTVRLLLNHGASLQARGQCRTNEVGTKTAEGWAKQRGHHEIADILKRRRLDQYKNKVASMESEKRKKQAFEMEQGAQRKGKKEAKLERWKGEWSQLGGKLLGRLRQIPVEPLLPEHPTIGKLLPTAPATVLVDLPPCELPMQRYFEIPSVKERIDESQARKRQAVAQESTLKAIHDQDPALLNFLGA